MDRLKVRGLFLTELYGHAPTVAICFVAMAFGGYVSSFLEYASYTAAAVSAEALPGLIPSVILVIMALMPALFVALGMYALVSASEESLKYEIGVFYSQGIDGYAVVDTWSTLYGWIPTLGYALGLCVYFGTAPAAFAQLQAVLADVASGLILVAGLPTFILIPRKLYDVLDTSPYNVVRSQE
ncbi:MAG: hypothetical protein JRN09_09600 [Nitrososphaerota archaeon]|nr:hypothetical protein [Nitrososphaerota archaeon]